MNIVCFSILYIFIHTFLDQVVHHVHGDRLVSCIWTRRNYAPLMLVFSAKSELRHEII